MQTHFKLFGGRVRPALLYLLAGENFRVGAVEISHRDFPELTVQNIIRLAPP